ncbi:GCN5-related protein N-acetyltransferase [Beutenbergia cavernae DSM 12333]|uniref:GCN5-related protein N-acetyltransferase n=1 Tax=Beutenbergia cavernae (strain ATCC BAA-8 / DSM 12333 / CCUG 43141 / JCM 11478 / NBRC 16432 / NCIMB 13614 / HKI 0122) TaxID=471853 RepID=C5C2G9_BEUC1|nr:GNAT family N-acetyltransferase [Beutenbergia cavernae]ACQ79655.1 GCN5-related protein N-acetyltransferase [Beutenbergia cavernae DSM 12333]
MNEVRAFRAEDADGVLALLVDALGPDAPSASWFGDYVLLEPNFDPEGLIVAVEDGRVVGAVHAVHARHAGRTLGRSGAMPVDPETGWITWFAVHPDHRRRGLGARLLTAAADYLARAGATTLVVSGYPPAYLTPGVDAVQFPDAVRLLERCGFDVASRPVAMDAPLATYRVPASVRELRARLESEGRTFAPARLAEIPEIAAFASQRLAPDWGEVLRASVGRHRHPERVIVAREGAAGPVIGFATYAAYPAAGIDRFGPFGVDPDVRGGGLGAVLLHETLAAMRREGAHSAWFLWTGATSPAATLYRRSGFDVTRTFDVMTRSTHPAIDA